MKLVLLSDLHLMWDNPVARLDVVRETQLRKMGYVMEWADRERATVLQAGDFFDTPRSWFLAEQWIAFFKSWGVDIKAIFGQHDTYMYSEATRHATILGALSAAGLVDLLSEEPEIIPTGPGRPIETHVYGASYSQPVPEPDDADALNILVIHAMIVDAKAWPGQEEFWYAPKFLADHPGYDLILCGDLHRRFHFTSAYRHIVNAGCLTRHTADKYNFTHRPGFYVYDTESRAVWLEEVPHEPAERVLSRAHLEAAARTERMLDDFIEAMECVEAGEEQDVSFFDNLVAVARESALSQKAKDLLAEVIDEEVKWK